MLSVLKSFKSFNLPGWVAGRAGLPDWVAGWNVKNKYIYIYILSCLLKAGLRPAFFFENTHVSVCVRKTLKTRKISQPATQPPSQVGQPDQPPSQVD